MKITGNALKRFAAVSIAVLLLVATARGQAPHDNAPNGKALDASIAAGNLNAYYNDITAWLAERIPANASQQSLLALLKDPVVANTLCQRQLLAKIGPDNLSAFARAGDKNKEFVGWLLKNTNVMDLYLEGATPIGIRNREANGWSLSINALEIWKNIYFFDPESHEGMLLRLAIATGLKPPPAISGYSKGRIDPTDRYSYLKAAQKNKELFPSFDKLTVWEYAQVTCAMPTNEELTWARNMINAWRPDLRKNEQVVNIVSEMWRRNSPNPYSNMQTMFQGGGKCGPRAVFGVIINQAFGIPAIGVGQPKHACVAYRVCDPVLGPQPGNNWKVGYGAGWQVSRVGLGDPDGVLGGIDFIEGIEARACANEFSQVEHLRWLASTSKEKGSAVMTIAQAVAATKPAKKTDLTKSLKPEEADAEVKPQAAPAAQGSDSASTAAAGTLHVDAGSFAKMSGVRLLDCYTGGKQVNFQKSLDNSWVEYKIDVPAAGIYELTMKTAAANVDQKFDIGNGEASLGIVQVPMSKGMWEMTPAIEVKLGKGPQALKVSAGFQRGVAVRFIELKAKTAL